MIPSLRYRCPSCGHADWRPRFTVASDGDGRRVVECPACGHRFRPVDDPRLA